MSRVGVRKRRAGTPRRKPTVFESSDVAVVFDEYPEEVRESLLQLRQLILDTAKATEGVGELEETLRWGEPTYLTTKSKSGSMVRINSKTPEQYALYVHCQTDLIAQFKDLYPTQFEYDGKRSIVFRQGEKLPKAKLRHCISLALTYHLNKRKRRPQAKRSSA